MTRKSAYGGLAADVIQSQKIGASDFSDIITFVEGPYGLNQPLYPVQRVILKTYYGLPLDDNPHGVDLDKPVPKNHPAYAEIAEMRRRPGDPDYGTYKHRVVITDFRRKNRRVFTEAGYLRHLYSEGRCNVSEAVPGKRELILAIGRRAGKTQMSAIITAYEVARLISLDDPQAYFGLPPAEEILLTTVATGEEQAGILFNKANGYLRLRDFYAPFLANSTMSYARLQTPADIRHFGRYANDDKAGATIKITFNPCRAKGLRGHGNIVVILDEEAHFNDEGQSSAEEVYSALSPSKSAFSPKDSLSGLPTGPVEARFIHISSPLGRQGHFYQMFQLAMKGGLAASDMLAIQAPSWEVNPTLEVSELEKEFVKDATAFFTEYGAVFSDQTRGWIDTKDDLLDCVEPDRRPAVRGVPRVSHYMGVDVALSGDGSAVAIGHFDDSERIILDLVDEIRAGEGEYEHLNRLDFEQVADWVAGYCERFLVTRGIADQWAGVPFEQALTRRGLRQIEAVFFTGPLSSQVYRNFKDFLLDRKLVLYDWPKPADRAAGEHCGYIQELLELQQKRRSKYIVEVAAPNVTGKHDDRADAIARMVWAASQAKSKQPYMAQPSTFRGMQPAGYGRLLRSPGLMHGGGTLRTPGMGPGMRGRNASPLGRRR